VGVEAEAEAAVEAVVLEKRRRRCPRGMANLCQQSGHAAVLAGAETRHLAAGVALRDRVRIWLQIRLRLVRRRRSLR
jgi:hypothetical protein